MKASAGVILLLGVQLFFSVSRAEEKLWQQKNISEKTSRYVLEANYPELQQSVVVPAWKEINAQIQKHIADQREALSYADPAWPLQESQLEMQVVALTPEFVTVEIKMIFMGGLSGHPFHDISYDVYDAKKGFPSTLDLELINGGSADLLAMEIEDHSRQAKLYLPMEPRDPPFGANAKDWADYKQERDQYRKELTIYQSNKEFLRQKQQVIDSISHFDDSMEKVLRAAAEDAIEKTLRHDFSDVVGKFDACIYRDQGKPQAQDVLSKARVSVVGIADQDQVIVQLQGSQEDQNLPDWCIVNVKVPYDSVSSLISQRGDWINWLKYHFKN